MMEAMTWMDGMPTLAELANEPVDDTITIEPRRPSNREVIDLLAETYSVSRDAVTGWLKGMDL